MDLEKKPIKVGEANHLAEVNAPVRAEVLSELPVESRDPAIENLVESAMTMGLMDVYQIRQWLGLGRLNIKSLTAVRDKIKRRWLEETENVFEYAKTQRAVQIQKAYEEVRKCESIYDEAITVKDKVAVKKLQLDWMLYISKLSFVDKMVEAAQPEMEINVYGGLTVEDKNG